MPVCFKQHLLLKSNVSHRTTFFVQNNMPAYEKAVELRQRTELQCYISETFSWWLGTDGVWLMAVDLSSKNLMHSVSSDWICGAVVSLSNEKKSSVYCCDSVRAESPSLESASCFAVSRNNCLTWRICPSGTHVNLKNGWVMEAKT